MNPAKKSHQIILLIILSPLIIPALIMAGIIFFKDELPDKVSIKLVWR